VKNVEINTLPETCLDFGDAIRTLKNGKKVARAGWNGKGMFLQLVNCYNVPVSPTSALLDWIGMKTADDCFVPWNASQVDVLAEDWEILE